MERGVEKAGAENPRDYFRPEKSHRPRLINDKQFSTAVNLSIVTVPSDFREACSSGQLTGRIGHFPQTSSYLARNAQTAATTSSKSVVAMTATTPASSRKASKNLCMGPILSGGGRRSAASVFHSCPTIKLSTLTVFVRWPVIVRDCPELLLAAPTYFGRTIKEHSVPLPHPHTCERISQLPVPLLI